MYLKRNLLLCFLLFLDMFSEVLSSLSCIANWDYAYYPGYYHFSSEEECYSLLKDLVREDDIILVKGSHGIHLVNVVECLVNL